MIEYEDEDEFIEFAEWVHKNCKIVKGNDIFKWEMKSKFKGHQLKSYETTQDILKKFLKTKNNDSKIQ